MAEASSPSSRKTALRTGLWLALFVLVAFGLRSYFGAEVGFDAGSERNLFTGNDPYYHYRTVTHVVETGRNLDYDTAINYPEGNWNPNPPLWTWTTAPVAVAMRSMGVADPVGTALNVMVAVWGALTVLPVYLIARDVWGRRAGLWSAFFLAVSAPHIQRSVWGYADHDAISIFFIVLAFAFLVKAFHALRHERFVANWRNGSSVGSGLAAAVRGNRNALAYAALAGVALTACANTWKGYPYALAVLAVAAAVQLVSDHLRRRDGTGSFLVYATTSLLAAALPYLLVYQHFTNYLPHTVYPAFYIFFGIVVAGLLLVPTRDLPSLLVLPGIVLAGILGLVLLLVVFPAVGNDLFSGLGYFAQSKLYSTIAEAQRPQLGEVAANFGFFTFLASFWGFGHVVRRTWKGDSAQTFLAAWAALAIYMTFAASRFIVNAAPLFAILIGYALAEIWSRLGLAEVRRRFAAQHGQGVVGRSIRSVSWKAAGGVALVALFLVLPNVWSGVDAGMPIEYEAEKGLYRSDSTTNKFGAFGISFELKDNGWNEAMDALSRQDTGVPLEQRPALIAWWDYGHWATGIGQHPAVADPFQSHYELSGRFLASDSEEEALSWLTIHLIGGDARAHGGAMGQPLRELLQKEAPGLLTLPVWWDYDAAYRQFSGNVTGDQVADLYEKVQAATGKRVGYLGVDRRMFPFDDPGTAGVDAPSIFYAPVFLANKNPDEYMRSQYVSGSTTLSVQRYGIDAGGNSYALDKPVYTDQAGQRWEEYNGYAYKQGQTPLKGFDPKTGIPLYGAGETMQVTQKFYDTLFGRAFGSLSTQVPAGGGLAHWRTIDESTQPSTQEGVSIRDVVLLAYYAGVPVSGKVLDADGQPMVGYQVTFVDGGGAQHDVATTGSEGNFTVIAPFSQGGDLRLAVLSEGNLVYSDNRTELQFTRQQADAGRSVAGVQITVSGGGLSGTVYTDRNGNGAPDAGEGLEGARVSVGSSSAVSGPGGNYSLANLRPGASDVEVSLAGYSDSTQHVVVQAGESTLLEAALTVKPSAVRIALEDYNGTRLSAVPITIEGASPGTTPAYTNATGVASASLPPGSYALKVDYNTTTAAGEPVRYVAHGSVQVPFGGDDVTVVLRRE